MPSLAVADALQRRGVQVTFAGSPDRIEARLVPEAGYELDTFRISGLPRRPSPALLRALLLAGRAPRACARILSARKAIQHANGCGDFRCGAIALDAAGNENDFERWIAPLDDVQDVANGCAGGRGHHPNALRIFRQ